MNNIKSLFDIIKQLSYVMTPKQKRESVLVLFAMLITSCLDLLSISVIYPLLEVMTNYENMRAKWYTSWIFMINPNAGVKEAMVIMCLAVIAVFILKNVMAIAFSYYRIRFSSNFQRDSSILAMESYLKRPYEFFVNTNSAVVLRGINSDSSAAYVVLDCLFQLIGEMITIVMLAAFLFATDWFVALCALTVAGLCFLLIVQGFRKRVKKIGKVTRQLLTRQGQCSYQIINGIKEITVMDRRKKFVDQFRDVAGEYAKYQTANGVINICPERIIEGICISGFIGVLCIRILIGVDFATFIPVMGAFAMAAFKILPSIAKVSGRINQIVFYQYGLKGYYDTLNEAEAIDRKANEREEKANAAIRRMEENGEIDIHTIGFRKKVEIKDIYWKYLNSKENVLNGLSMTINKGESIAFIGSSGAGKTTLADIILGLFEPQSGTIEMDGIDIFSIPHEWSKIIGYVPQSVFLADDTIRANIAFGLTGEDVTDERIWDALEQAQLKSFVESLPDGLDTIVGERGIKFSGGQRQRVAIARALYEDPDILVLDEATSALDTETETAVMESIDALQGHKTLIIVAHRLSTIRNCDKIYEIGHGKAVERDKDEVLS